MSDQSLQDQITEMLTSLFRRGSRYQTEKLATVGGYIALSIASLAWAFSGTNSNKKKYVLVTSPIAVMINPIPTNHQ